MDVYVPNDGWNNRFFQVPTKKELKKLIKKELDDYGFFSTYNQGWIVCRDLLAIAHTVLCELGQSYTYNEWGIMSCEGDPVSPSPDFIHPRHRLGTFAL